VKSQLEVRIARKVFRSSSGGAFEALRDIAFTLQSGTVGALLGPSGSGKTTLLRIITGLDTDYTGQVLLPAHGRLGMVFQEPRLLPRRTVEQKVRLGAPDATDAAWRWRGPSPSSPTSWCSTSRSSPSTWRWRSACRTNSPPW
jgi:NitT/TauT family transport system ATP-binding protein